MQVTIKIKQANIDKLIKNMCILIDSREQENFHITDFFDKKGITYKVRKLEFGDYSCQLMANSELELLQDISLEKEIAIEKKNSLDEIANNFTTGRTAFENEFIRAKENCKNFVLLIENASWESIRKHEYQSLLNENAMYNSLISWRTKYNFQIDFVKSEYTASHILKLLQDKLKKILEE